MKHILDNPIWGSLTTRSKNLANGNQLAKYYHPEVSSFAGLRDNSGDDFKNLHQLVPHNTDIRIFTPGEIIIPDYWTIIQQVNIFQMVYKGSDQLTSPHQSFVQLSEKDIPGMMALVRLTNPGPFLSRSIDFGYYEGIFDGDHLVAMAGQRMQPDGYTEISAVCTHPDYLGKGYAFMLISNQIRCITAASQTPFLHVFPGNLSAVNLYKKLGFETRREMTVYTLQKQ
ncbi:GNAT family N-acetyltransferase [Mucilaginibacter sp. SP1R1]|uniref:GNAT family N-acetyltransferase n=1 Tax=Mucilaginibacter sp. SP1R1 TaxID=2723091 RepID=UPI00161E573B|nr:GNAT family N-acetyltransferase [Mucilaginibacter sp. SP1R1]MBB6147669.1 putative GNAT family acetyltransferase [Mucilaginibacter sp. SP1R1]